MSSRPGRRCSTRSTPGASISSLTSSAGANPDLTRRMLACGQIVALISTRAAGSCGSAETRLDTAMHQLLGENLARLFHLLEQPTTIGVWFAGLQAQPGLISPLPTSAGSPSSLDSLLVSVTSSICTLLLVYLRSYLERNHRARRHACGARTGSRKRTPSQMRSGAWAGPGARTRTLARSRARTKPS